MTAGGAAENPSQWLARVESEINARRARVLLGEAVIEERDFTCAVAQNSVQPDGSVEYSVRFPGGNVTVRRKFGAELTGKVQSGFAGDADSALERAFEAVENLIRFEAADEKQPRRYKKPHNFFSRSFVYFPGSINLIN